MRFFVFLFFSEKKFTCHSFIQFSRPEKKQPRKKKQLFHSFKKYPPKVRKNDLIQVKKNGTLDPPPTTHHSIYPNVGEEEDNPVVFMTNRERNMTQKCSINGVISIQSCSTCRRILGFFCVMELEMNHNGMNRFVPPKNSKKNISFSGAFLALFLSLMGAPVHDGMNRFAPS